MDKQKIRDKSGRDNTGIRLVEKSKRGILHVLFGRTMLIIVLFALQIFLLYEAFRSMRRFMPYIYGLLMVFYGTIIIRLVNKSSDPANKITWILLIVLLPPVGVTLYLFVEFDLGHRMLNRRLSALIRDTAPLQPDQSELRERLARENPDLGALSEYLWHSGYFPPYANTQVTYLPSGEAALEAILAALDEAERFIFMEFFIVDEGVMWGQILQKLEEKIAQGVEVRLLYDGTCALFRLPYSYPKMLAQLGIQCKMFSPLRPVMSTHYNNRDHRKILVVDGKIAFTGGVNLADEYINIKHLYGHWKDVAVMMRGEAVQSFTLMFLQMWNLDGNSERFARYLEVDTPPVTAPGYVLPYGDSPLDDERVGEMVYLDIINRATRYVHIMTPYLILNSEMLTALCFAAKRGVEVVLLLPHIPDKKYAFALAKTHYRALLEAGVCILEYTPGFVHAKVFVSDDVKAVVGTINLDYRSLYLHFECAAYLYGVPAIEDIEQDFRETAAKCQEIHLDDLRREKLSTRVLGWLLKVLAPLM
ncbi:MAG: PLDc N-terminal domain-containing protein [Clostridia bacterium]|nr:PLDc N-terminal domain-containing protein [Clostridia bacterium]